MPSRAPPRPKRKPRRPRPRQMPRPPRPRQKQCPPGLKRRRHPPRPRRRRHPPNQRPEQAPEPRLGKLPLVDRSPGKRPRPKRPRVNPPPRQPPRKVADIGGTPEQEHGENPLTAGLERLPVAPTTLVIFGATGDLARRKLLPALYNLAHEGALPERFHLVGVSRKEKEDEDYAKECEQAIRRFSRRTPDEDVLRSLLDNVRYVPGTFDEESVYEELGKTLDEFEQEAGEPGNRAFYLSTAPNFFPIIVEQLGRSELAQHEDAEVRLIIEKPFGTTLEEARELNRNVLSIFDEAQVYRIDHYLGKETVQNMMAFRFANGMFEPLWNRNYIDSIQITASEDLGIGTRAGYYDEAGALRDLIQNHMLQLLCHVAMEPPVSFTAEEVRNEKVKVLAAIPAPTQQEVSEMAVRAQYARGHAGGEDVPGYLEEDGVPPDSTTETFAALRLE